MMGIPTLEKSAYVLKHSHGLYVTIMTALPWYTGTSEDCLNCVRNQEASIKPMNIHLNENVLRKRHSSD